LRLGVKLFSGSGDCDERIARDRDILFDVIRSLAWTLKTYA